LATEPKLVKTNNMYTRTKENKIFKKSQRGFTLLFALLIASLLASLGLSMYSIASKELTLTSVGKDSQFAFYAADSGVECALYWDFKKNAFSTSTAYSLTATPPPKCGGQLLKDFPSSGNEGVFDGVSGLGGTNISTFWFEPGGYCTYVTVTKSTTAPHTSIVSLGYNTPCNDPNNPRRLEQAVQSMF